MGGLLDSLLDGTLEGEENSTSDDDDLSQFENSRSDKDDNYSEKSGRGFNLIMCSACRKSTYFVSTYQLYQSCMV